MKQLHKLVKNNHQPVPLFTALMEMKTQPIHGIPMVSSDDQSDQPAINLHLISAQLEKYKLEKAQQVVKMYRQTNISVKDIVQKYKEQYRKQATAIIDLHINNKTLGSSSENRQSPGKIGKQLGSTLPGSEDRTQNETPVFDVGSGKSHEMTIDLRQFTLGQREQGSQKSYGREQMGPGVSQFLIREPSSRRIKDKIMNNAKSKK